MIQALIPILGICGVLAFFLGAGARFLFKAKWGLFVSLIGTTATLGGFIAEWNRGLAAIQTSSILKPGNIYAVLDDCENIGFPAAIFQELGEEKGEVKEPKFVRLKKKLFPIGTKFVYVVDNNGEIELQPLSFE